MNLNEIKYHLNEIDKLTAAMDLGDIFSYSKVKEVLMAAELGHTVPKNYSGADGIMPDGTPVEYKSTIGKKISATYNGISVQDTWEEQEKYIIEEKIGKYPHKALDYTKRKKQSTRNLKIECPSNEHEPYFVRMSKTMYEKAKPLCGICGEKMTDDPVGHTINEIIALSQH